MVTMRAGTPLTVWLESADSDAVGATRPKALELVHGVHAAGVCYRDLHVENVVIIGDNPVAIDFEHACDVDPAWRCYDISGPLAQVPLLPAHAQGGGVLGTSGIWWDGPLEPRFGGRYIPLGMIFGLSGGDTIER